MAHLIKSGPQKYSALLRGQTVTGTWASSDFGWVEVGQTLEFTKVELAPDGFTVIADPNTIPVRVLSKRSEGSDVILSLTRA